MKRRSFFQSLAKAAAIIALAPQIAFGVKLELPATPAAPVFFDIHTPIMWAYFQIQNNLKNNLNTEAH